MPVDITLSDEEAKCLIRALVLNYSDTAEDFDSQNISVCNGIKENLLGRIVSRTDNFDFFDDVRAERYSSRLPVRKKLFMGAGYHSVLQKNDLHKRLEFACSELSGIQQNGGQGTEFDEQMDRECNENIRAVLKDMLWAYSVYPEDLINKCS